MQPGQTGLVYDTQMCRHFDPRASHPESPVRIERIYEKLLSLGLVARCQMIPSRLATQEELLSVHAPYHVEMMSNLTNQTDEDLVRLARDYNSIYLNRDTFAAARLSAGSLLSLVQQVLDRTVHNGAAIIRPPGHHAECREPMGFCIFNNVAIAAKWAVNVMGLQRVLIVDWDVHHGNGTQRMFYDDPTVLYFSVHRFDNGTFYPASANAHPSKIGVGAGAGFNINVAWNGSGYGDADYLACWNTLLLPVAYEFAPQLVLVSAGFDAARGDPLGSCDVTAAGFAHLTHQLMSLANGRVVVALEGGYNLESISNSMAAVVATLLGDVPPQLESMTCSPSASRAILETVRAVLPFWKALTVHTNALMLAERWWCEFCSADNPMLSQECVVCECPKPEDGTTYYPSGVVPLALSQAAEKPVPESAITTTLLKGTKRTRERVIRGREFKAESHPISVIPGSTDPVTRPTKLQTAPDSLLAPLPFRSSGLKLSDSRPPKPSLDLLAPSLNLPASNLALNSSIPPAALDVLRALFEPGET